MKWAFLLLLIPYSAGGSVMFATGTLERLSQSDYQLELNYIIYPDVDEYPAGGPWDYIYPQGAVATIQGNFTSDYQPSYGSPYVSTIIHPIESSLFLTLEATQDWVFGINQPYPGHTFIGVYGKASFTSKLPQQIGETASLTEIPEASPFALMGLTLPLIALSARRRHS